MGPVESASLLLVIGSVFGFWGHDDLILGFVIDARTNICLLDPRQVVVILRKSSFSLSRFLDRGQVDIVMRGFPWLIEI